MHPNEYRKLREGIGERDAVAEMLDINAKHLSRRELGTQRITREAELAMRFLAQDARKPKPRKTPIAKRNETRKAKEWERAYGSRERVEWVNEQACVVPRCKDGPRENMHTVTGGMSRKANADTIVPACKRHHREFHRIGRKTFEAKHGTGDLLEAARLVDKAWRER